MLKSESAKCPACWRIQYIKELEDMVTKLGGTIPTWNEAEGKWEIK